MSASGRCECGGVRFNVTAPRETVSVCHCHQCRRMAGHAWACTAAPEADIDFEADETLAWYRSSDRATRGFCRVCGASLFYRLDSDAVIDIAAGCLDAPTGLHVGRHIFVADKGDYYEIDDGAPQFEQDGS